MTAKMVFWDDLKIKGPSKNLAINRACANLVKKGNYDLVARTYLHDKGVILGRGESIRDVNEEFCKTKGYEVISRPSGGSAILVEPDLTLCYSVFFNSKKFGGRFNIHEAYKSIVLPLAKNLGNGFSVLGNYYLRYDFNGQAIPIAGHAMKSYGEVTQFDGVINLKKFDMGILEKVLRLRELWEVNGSKYLKVNGMFYDLKGVEISLDENSLQFLRSERKELEKIAGLEDIGMSAKEFKQILKKSLEEGFGNISEVDDLPFDGTKIREYIEYSKLKDDSKGRRFLGHCFIDLVEEEPEIVYSGNDKSE